MLSEADSNRSGTNRRKLKKIKIGFGIVLTLLGVFHTLTEKVLQKSTASIVRCESCALIQWKLDEARRRAGLFPA